MNAPNFDLKEGLIEEYRLPSWKKVKVDMDHIMSGNTPGGGRGDDNKDKFPKGMSEAAILKAIEERQYFHIN